MAITLPTAIIPALTQDPKNLIIFGAPKAGKTTLLSTLPNLLILDFENGSDYVSCMKLKVGSINELKEICTEIRKAGNPYKYIAIDTITALVEFAKPLALKEYFDGEAGKKHLLKLQAEGKNPADINLFLLPFGAGYAAIKSALNKIIALVSTCADHIIIVGHVKMNAKEDELGEIATLDLPGQSKRHLAAMSDAIAYLNRDEDKNLVLSFKSDSVECGARPAHLADREIIVAEYDEKERTFTSHWDRIFPSEANN